ncbi:MAG TPA: VWA domain-containing protein [Candidatus Binataceae bacterium]|nr:VWA domain-containing protein [Candidatus Binataceae bacterium]
MGFLDPRNLLWGVSLAVLVAIYLRSRARPTIDVSSLMLFDEVPAPSASMRQVRFDLLFWLEAAALCALTLAIAGFFVRIPERPAHGRSHALVFALGAGMTATESGSSRLDRAKRQALDIIADAHPDDQFSIITYALEANLAQAPTSDAKELRAAIGKLNAIAVATRPAALRAALMRARGAAEIDLFADRPPPGEALGDIATAGKFVFHQVAADEANLAIVSLDPGVPRASKMRVGIRNFGAHPQLCDLKIYLDEKDAAAQTLMLAPREQVTAPYDPLPAGGIVHAHIASPDAIAADNDRYVLATAAVPLHALVVSPDPAVRDDLARVLLAVNPNFRIEAVDPASYHAASNDSDHFALAIVHDSDAAVHADSTLLVFPPAGASKLIPGLTIDGTASGAELHGATQSGGNGLPIGATRILAMPEWMEVTSSATLPGKGRMPVAAIGQGENGSVGVIAFDVRDRMLLDPDHLDALVGTVDLIKRLVTPANVQIVATGTYVNLPASGPAKITSPDGSVQTVTPDKSGRIVLRPLMAGRYKVDNGKSSVQVFANYYDAIESDTAVTQVTSAKSPQRELASIPAPPREPQIQPMLIVLALMAMLALLAESAMLARRAGRWGMRHV